MAALIQASFMRLESQLDHLASSSIIDYTLTKMCSSLRARDELVRARDELVRARNELTFARNHNCTLIRARARSRIHKLVIIFMITSSHNLLVANTSA